MTLTTLVMGAQDAPAIPLAARTEYCRSVAALTRVKLSPPYLLPPSITMDAVGSPSLLGTVGFRSSAYSTALTNPSPSGSAFGPLTESGVPSGQYLCCHS